jgi:hypothetical protein
MPNSLIETADSIQMCSMNADHNYMDYSGAQNILDGLLAGVRALDLNSLVKGLKSEERRALLCSVCMMRDELSATSIDHAREADQMLGACPFYIDGRRTCV